MNRITAALMMAILGIVLFSAFVIQDIRLRPDLNAKELPWRLIVQYLIAMGVGGAFAGYVFGGLFGRSGFGGWVLTLIAGVFAASVAGLLGSALEVLPDILSNGVSTTQVIRIAFGLLVLPLALIEEPWLIIVVGAILIVTHLRCRAARQVRQTDCNSQRTDL